VDLELSMSLFMRFLLIIHLLKLHLHKICAPILLEKNVFDNKSKYCIFTANFWLSIYDHKQCFLFLKNMFVSTLIFRLSLKVKMANAVADVWPMIFDKFASMCQVKKKKTKYE
jgi:hypothetical protein